MAGFRYRLQPLLDEKLTLKQAAEDLLAEKQRRLRGEEAKLRELQVCAEALTAKKAGFRKDLLAARPGLGISGLDTQLRRDYLMGLDQDIQDARDNVYSQQTALDAAGEQVAQARRELADRTRDVEILKKHRERLERRYLRDLERKASGEQDEIGNVLYLARRRT